MVLKFYLVVRYQDAREKELRTAEAAEQARAASIYADLAAARDAAAAQRKYATQEEANREAVEFERLQLENAKIRAAQERAVWPAGFVCLLFAILCIDINSNHATTGCRNVESNRNEGLSGAFPLPYKLTACWTGSHQYMHVPVGNIAD